MADRVVLRPPEPIDYDLMFRWVNDEPTRRLSSTFHEVTWEEHISWITSASEDQDREILLIVNSESAEPIGQIHVFGMSHVHRSCEFSIRIGREGHRGRGFGTDAVNALLEHLWAQSIHRVFLHVFEDNLRAIRTYKKCGFAIEGILRDAARIDDRWRNLVLMAAINPND